VVRARVQGEVRRPVTHVEQSSNRECLWLETHSHFSDMAPRAAGEAIDLLVAFYMNDCIDCHESEIRSTASRSATYRHEFNVIGARTQARKTRVFWDALSSIGYGCYNKTRATTRAWRPGSREKGTTTSLDAEGDVYRVGTGVCTEQENKERTNRNQGRNGGLGVPVSVRART